MCHMAGIEGVLLLWAFVVKRRQLADAPVLTFNTEILLFRNTSHFCGISCLRFGSVLYINSIYS